MNRGLGCVLVGHDLYMTSLLKLVNLGRCPYQTCVVMTQGGFVLRSSKSDDHSTAHGHVLSRVVSRLIRISVFPCFWDFDFFVK